MSSHLTPAEKQQRVTSRNEAGEQKNFVTALIAVRAASLIATLALASPHLERVKTDG